MGRIIGNRGYAAIGLHNCKNKINLGSVLRASKCYNANFVAIAGNRIPKKYWVATDTEKAYLDLPLMWIDNLKDIIHYDCVPVAVELLPNAKSLVDYKHPERAFYIFGGEDQTLGERVTEWCRDVIYIPTNSCMNLAATVNVVLYDRLAKFNKIANLADVVIATV